jgi:uncharacterized membrane protein
MYRIRMNAQRKIEWSLFLLGVAGTLFSGYLSGVKFFTNQCALGETCPYFLGYPSCYFGFAMFLIITLSAGLHAFRVLGKKSVSEVVYAVSILGILFSGYFVLGEIPSLIEKGMNAYVFGLPTCALGLIFYVAIFLLTLHIRHHSNEQ